MLRCNYEGSTGTPQASQSTHAHPASVRSAVRAQAPKQQPPAKTPTPVPSDVGLGGMFGLFDGACDVNRDGTAPYPASPEGYYAPRKTFAWEDDDSDGGYRPRRGGSRMADNMPVNSYRQGGRGPGYNDQPSRPMGRYVRPIPGSPPPRSSRVRFRKDGDDAPSSARYDHGMPGCNNAPYNAYPYGRTPAQLPAGMAQYAQQAFTQAQPPTGVAQHVQQAYPQAQPYGPVWVPIPAGQTPGSVPQGGYDIQQELWQAQEQLRQLKAFNESQAHQVQLNQPPQPQPQQQTQPHYQPGMPMIAVASSQAPPPTGNPIDPEMQRGAIWRLGQKFWQEMGYDGRILAAAVPYIMVLRYKPIIDLDDTQRAEVFVAPRLSCKCWC